jgi:hypothetical protein
LENPEAFAAVAAPAASEAAPAAAEAEAEEKAEEKEESDDDMASCFWFIRMEITLTRWPAGFRSVRLDYASCHVIYHHVHLMQADKNTHSC